MQILEVALCVVLSLSAIALSQHAAGQASSIPRAVILDGKPSLCPEGCEFSDLNAAIKSSFVGGIITVAPGTYSTCGIVDKPLQLIGLKDESGKRAHLTGVICDGKGPLVLRAANVVIQGFEISNVTVPDRNGACIRIDPQAGDITIRDVYCHDSEDGVLGGPERGSVTIEESRFERNGFGGKAHGIYINSGDNFVLRHSQIISTKGGGHTLKSGAKRTVIEDSVLAALDGQNSRAIDAYGGGVLEVRRSVIQQGQNSDNAEAIGIALEPNRINPNPHSTLVENNWIIFDDLGRRYRWLFKAKPTGPISVRGNKVIGMTELADSNLSILFENNDLYRNRNEAGLPMYDGALSSLPKPGS